MLKLLCLLGAIACCTAGSCGWGPGKKVAVPFQPMQWSPSGTGSLTVPFLYQQVILPHLTKINTLGWETQLVAQGTSENCTFALGIYNSKNHLITHTDFTTVSDSTWQPYTITVNPPVNLVNGTYYLAAVLKLHGSSGFSHCGSPGSFDPPPYTVGSYGYTGGFPKKAPSFMLHDQTSYPMFMSGTVATGHQCSLSCSCATACCCHMRKTGMSLCATNCTHAGGKCL